jgi:hypothetical protein
MILGKILPQKRLLPVEFMVTHPQLLETTLILTSSTKLKIIDSQQILLKSLSHLIFLFDICHLLLQFIFFGF